MTITGVTVTREEEPNNGTNTYIDVETKLRRREEVRWRPRKRYKGCQARTLRQQGRSQRDPDITPPVKKAWSLRRQNQLNLPPLSNQSSSSIPSLPHQNSRERSYPGCRARIG